MPDPRRIAVANNKGGQGKTTFVVQMATQLADRKRRVLVIDMDPQGNTTRRLGITLAPGDPTIATVLDKATQDDDAFGTAATAVRPCGWPEYTDLIHVIPSNDHLEACANQTGTAGAVRRLQKVIDGVDDEYDYTLIDCPPNLGHLTQLALVPSDYVICTVEPEYDGVEGATKLRDYIQKTREDLYNPNLSITAYVISRFRSNLGSHEHFKDHILENFSPVWEPIIPERSPHKDAADNAITLMQTGNRAAPEIYKIWSELTDAFEKAIKP